MKNHKKPKYKEKEEVNAKIKFDFCKKRKTLVKLTSIVTDNQNKQQQQ